MLLLLGIECELTERILNAINGDIESILVENFDI